jgi:hypothetical protein
VTTYSGATPPDPPTPSAPLPSGGATVANLGLGAALTGPPLTLGRARAPRHRGRTGAWPPAGVPQVTPDSLESIADDVAFWIETTAQDVARSLMDGVYAPFSARVTADDQAQFYGETLFTPEGTLDVDQWQKEYARLGPQGLARAINGAALWRRARGLRVLLPQSRFQPVGSDMTGITPAAGITAPPEGEGPFEGAAPEETGNVV